MTRRCDHKRRYSRAAAIRAASRLGARAYGGRLSPYVCPHCGAWHVGHALADRTTRHQGASRHNGAVRLTPAC